MNLETLETLVSFMETLVKEEGMGLTSVLRGCVAMRETARNAIGGPRSGDVSLGSSESHGLKATVS